MSEQPPESTSGNGPRQQQLDRRSYELGLTDALEVVSTYSETFRVGGAVRGALLHAAGMIGRLRDRR